MDVTRKQLTNIEAGNGIGGPMNMFVNVPAFPTADMQGGRAAELRYALFQRLARSDEGADGRLGARHRRPLLSAADARHVDRCVRLARLADDRHGSGDLSRRRRRAGGRTCATVQSRNSSCQPARSVSMRRRPMCGSSAAPRRMGRPTMTRFTRSRLATRSRRCRNGAKTPDAVEVTDRSERRHEDAAEDAGRHACRPTTTSPTPPSF